MTMGPRFPDDEQQFVRLMVEAVIRIGLLAALVMWCLDIARPFLVPIVWGVIIAVAVYPGYRRLEARLGDRRGLAASLVTLLMLAALVVPALLLAGSLINGAQEVAAALQAGTFSVPAPPQGLASWPLIGDELSRFWRLASENYVETAWKIVHSVTAGILGVALLQGLLAGIGFMVAGVPAAGLLTLVCIFFGVIQLGVVVVLVPVAIWLFSSADTTTAVIFLVYAILIAPLDNILKPILLGRGVKVPMVVVFVGAIGGFISLGVVGLFVGAVVFTLGYGLFLAWLRADMQPHAGGA
jgi:predicted PurR-regulated permease PerM